MALCFNFRRNSFVVHERLASFLDLDESSRSFLNKSGPKFGDKIHGDIVPLPFRYLGLYQQSRWSLMFSFDLGTRQTLANIGGDVGLHIGPPI
ncbi:hypothetical protein Tco_0459177 [Tanacetum coccineum]